MKEGGRRKAKKNLSIIGEYGKLLILPLDLNEDRKGGNQRGETVKRGKMKGNHLS